MSALRPVIDPLLSLVYPPRCAVCGTLGETGLCARCADSITPVPSPTCQRCGHPFGEGSGCFNCRTHTPAFVRGRAMGAYEGVLRDAIHHFKFRDRPGLAEPLGVRLAQYARREAAALNGLHFDAILPVPMHPVRQRLRGYNQSERLARVVARELRLPLATRLLVRCRPTRPQVGLSGLSRQTNLTGAFAVPDAEAVSNKTLLLVDDVSTTGATLSACATVLMSAGAKAVYTLALAAD